MMENHSFDNFFGVYPTLNRTATNPVLQEIQRPINLLTVSNLPALKQIPNNSFWTVDPFEGYGAYHADWDNGSMMGFAQNSGPQSMTYFTSAQLAVEWDWAEEYGLGDMYFASYLSDTAPNRLMSLAGYTPVSGDYGPPPYIGVNQTIFAQLSAYGISWGYYVNEPSGTPYPLTYFSGFAQYEGNVKSVSAFEHELAVGGLPDVSWVMPLGGGVGGLSQHPSENVTLGETWMLGIVNSVMGSPYWNTTAIFITYDEGGGYYDQVSPPTLDGQQLGFRVPLIVISPFAKEDYVSNTVLNHCSLLAFIDYNWGLPPLNRFVEDSNLPLDFFDFNQTYPNGFLARQPIFLSNSSSFPAQPQIPFGQLPYQRTGQSSVTLGKMGYTAYQETTPSATAANKEAGTPTFLIVAALILVFLIGIRRNRWKSRR
jgi:phospholipase C